MIQLGNCTDIGDLCTLKYVYCTRDLPQAGISSRPLTPVDDGRRARKINVESWAKLTDMDDAFGVRDMARHVHLIVTSRV